MSCLQCKTPFAPKVRHQLYCGKTCARAADAERNRRKRNCQPLDEPVACGHCQTMFVRACSTARYCSKACQDAARSVRAAASRPIVSRECPRCRSVFETRSSRQVFCSDDCEPVQTSPAQRQCPVCRSFFEGNRQTTCSVRCRKRVRVRRHACEATPLDAEGEILVRDLENCPRRLRLAKFVDRFEGGLIFYRGPVRPTWLSPPRASR